MFQRYLHIYDIINCINVHSKLDRVIRPVYSDRQNKIAKIWIGFQ